MKRLLIIATLALSSCAPLLGTLQSDDATLTASGYTVTFDPGKQDAEDVAVYLDTSLLDPAISPTFNVPCKRAGDGFGCILGTVPGGKPLTVTFTGVAVNSGSATFYRPGSTRPVLTPLKGE